MYSTRWVSIASVLFGALLHAPAAAHLGHDPLVELHQKVWTTREGIPHNTVNDITQTPDGYLWFATWEGIARFNGHRFRIYERSPETKMADAGVLALSVDPRGRLLAAGARGSVVMTKGHQWQAFAPAPSMVMDALIDTDEQLWLATQGAGIIRRPIEPGADPAQAHSYMLEASASQLLETDSGIWAATSRGLLRVQGDRQTLLGPESGLPPVPVLSLLALDDGALLAGTERGLYRLPVGRSHFEPVHPALSDLAISTLLFDDGGHLWIGTINQGLFRLAGDRLEHLGTDDGLPNNRILSLFQDLEDSIWVGTNGGLLRLRSAPFVTLTREQGLAGNFVRAILPHSDGSLWVGTSEGVSRIRGRNIETVADAGEPIELSVLSLEEMPQGDVLIGTHSDGVLHWSEGRIVARHDRSTGLPSNDIRFIQVDSSERIWVATASGLGLVDDGVTRSFQPEDGLPGDFIITLHEDRAGRIWVGTGFGLARFRGDDFEPISLYHLDEALYVYGIHEDRERPVLWLATDRGLIRFDPESGQADLVGRSAGLPVDKYFHVIDDRSGGFWLTSNRGIVRIQKEQAIAVADGTHDTIEFELYTEGDGMLSAQANGGAGPPAAWHDGRVWIATAAGVASVDPDHLTRYEETVLPVSIEHFEADGAAIPLDADSVNLPAGTSRIAMHYAGLGFIMPQRIRYRTLLEGFDSTWVERHGQSVAEYTNLGPGDYVFRVSAAYPYGDWNGSEAAVHFSIAPLPWQRAWFWVLAAVSTALLIALLIKWRLRRLERRAAELSNQVEEKTRELKQQAERFERQARIDQLTGLANRRAFDEWLEAEFLRSAEKNEKLALVVMDLDHFKTINDRYSHLVGDEVMRFVADLLTQHIRDDDQAARWGGEEFTLTFRSADARAAAQVSERIRQSLETANLEAIAPGLSITASFGVSDSGHAQSYEALLRHADQALYRAKAEGRNRVVVHESDAGT